uniref:DUF834 domain-containing protein n=1 Tax=Oryza sativa subsp. japonica TaxID=39947 RepID=Q5Z4R7_ORYSJ|nr:hypothetical protein [Oryza sativa Japonica Group]
MEWGNGAEAGVRHHAAKLAVAVAQHGDGGSGGSTWLEGSGEWWHTVQRGDHGRGMVSSGNWGKRREEVEGGIYRVGEGTTVVGRGRSGGGEEGKWATRSHGRVRPREVKEVGRVARDWWRCGVDAMAAGGWGWG